MPEREGGVADAASSVDGDVVSVEEFEVVPEA
jgi:hypothetical protein